MAVDEGLNVDVVFEAAELDDQSIGVGIATYPEQLGISEDLLTEEELDGVLDGIVAGASGAIMGREIDKERIDFLGHRAVDFTIRLDEGVLRARSFLVGSTAYTVQVVGEADVVEESYQRLVRSFALLN